MQNTTTTPDTPETVTTFEQFGLKDELLQSIRYAGFKTPSPIQAAAIPLVLEGRDVVGQARVPARPPRSACRC